MDKIKIISEFKPNSIFDLVEKDFFLENDDITGPSEGHDYMRCGNYYEVYYAISKFYQPETIFEIGVRYGYSLYSLIKGSSKIKYALGYDIDEKIYSNSEWISEKLNISPDEVNTIDISKSQLIKFCPDVEIDIKNQNSQEIVEIEGYMDLIHIDGNHSYDGKVHDLELTKQKGKVIVIDDYSHIMDVKNATDDFIKNNISIIKDHYFLDSFRGTYILEY